MAQQNQTNESQMVYSSEQKLREALSHYLLTYSTGKMAQPIDLLIHLYEERDDTEPVWLTGDPAGFFRDALTKLLECWGIEIQPGIPGRRHRVHLCEIHLPTIDERREDLPLVIAYFVQETIQRRSAAKLPKKTPVKYVSLDLLWFMLGYPDWQDFDHLRVVVDRSIRRARNEVLTLHHVLSTAGELFPVLLGFFRDQAKEGSGTEIQLQALAYLCEHYCPGRVQGPLVGWYLNWDRSEKHRIEQLRRVPLIPIVSIHQAMANLEYLRQIGKLENMPKNERNRIEKCFQLRRASLSEEEIAYRLDFKDIHSYDQWTEEFHINIRFNVEDTVLNDFESAKQLLLHSAAASGEPAKPVVIVHRRYNQIEVDGKRENYSERVVESVAFMIESQQRCLKDNKEPMFDRAELCQHLEGKKITTGLAKSSRRRIIHDVLEVTPLKDQCESLSRKKKVPGYANKFILEIDMSKSRVDR